MRLCVLHVRVQALFIKIARVFTICGGDVAPFISIISAEEFTRVEAVASLLICQLNVTENSRGGGGSVDLAKVFSPLPPNASIHPAPLSPTIPLRAE